MPEIKGFELTNSSKTRSRPRRKNYLLAIGIDKYLSVGKLSNAVRDAQMVSELLAERYGFEDRQMLFDKEATRQGIRKALKQQIKRVGAQDNLVIYFSGHGHYDEELDDAYWVPVDARFGDDTDYISYEYIIKCLANIKAHHIFLIVDSCYSGAIMVRDQFNPEERLEKDPSRWMLASGRNEVVPDGISGKNSPFATELLDVLTRYSEEGISVFQLVDKVTTAVTHESFQTPIGRPLFQVGDKGGMFILRAKNHEGFIWEEPPRTYAPEGTHQARDKKLYSILVNPKVKWVSIALIITFSLIIGLIQFYKEIKPQATILTQDQALKEIDRIMVSIPSGSFEMGSNKFDDDEMPIHEVKLSSFEISAFEVTQAQWEAIMETNPAKNSWYYEPCLNCPVTYVAWDTAQAFIQRLNSLSGKSYRLPTEAEWEYAARANENFIYAGSNNVDEVAWCYSYEEAEENTHPVGTLKPNTWNLYDMSGNVSEWCEDRYGKDYYASSVPDNPKGPNSGRERVLRGGSYPVLPKYCRVSARASSETSLGGPETGFRLARTP